MKNRWLIALSAIGIHICIGSVYAWSVLTKPIMQAMGFTLKETTWTFSISILFLGLSAGFLGDYVEKYGPRKSGLTSTCFFGLGMFGTALALHLNSLPLLYLFYGVIGGIGLGTGYITPVSTLVKWFPNNRGFATGLAIMGFGFASLIAGPLMQILVAKYGLVQNFIILGCVYMVITCRNKQCLHLPADCLRHHFLLRRRLLLYARLPQRSVRHERTQRHPRQDPDCLGHGWYCRASAAVLDP